MFTKEDSQSLPDATRNVAEDIPPLIISEDGVIKLLRNIKINKATGPYELPNRVLQECATEVAQAVTAIFQRSIDSGQLPKDWRDANIAPVFKKGDRHLAENNRPVSLTAIFQRSIDSGQLPKDWRDANIAPVFKKGDRHLAENYRPVSSTCVFSKILEHIICHHMLNHLDKHKVLTSLNHGFMSGYSCETQLVATAHDLLSYYDQNKQVDTVILDFSKAFDTAPHRKLLHKLDAYGIRGPLLSWITNFLHNGQCVW